MNTVGIWDSNPWAVALIRCSIRKNALVKKINGSAPTHTCDLDALVCHACLHRLAWQND